MGSTGGEEVGPEYLACSGGGGRRGLYISMILRVCVCVCVCALFFMYSWSITVEL